MCCCRSRCLCVLETSVFDVRISSNFAVVWVEAGGGAEVSAVRAARAREATRAIAAASSSTTNTARCKWGKWGPTSPSSWSCCASAATAFSRMLRTASGASVFETASIVTWVEAARGSAVIIVDFHAARDAMVVRSRQLVTVHKIMPVVVVVVVVVVVGGGGGKFFSDCRRGVRRGTRQAGKDSPPLFQKR